MKIPPKLINIVLTGGPGGGKTTFIRQLRQNLEWARRFLALPEAVSIAGAIGVSPKEKLFQRLIVKIQKGLEDVIQEEFRNEEIDLLICERGTLDPLAYWLANGWTEAEFFAFTETDLEVHYRRYDAVIHLVTAADGASGFYKSMPYAHRSETPEQAVRLDRLIKDVWDSHPAYFRIDNQGKNWEEKTLMVLQALRQVLLEKQDSLREFSDR